MKQNNETPMSETRRIFDIAYELFMDELAIESQIENAEEFKETWIDIYA